MLNLSRKSRQLTTILIISLLLSLILVACNPASPAATPSPAVQEQATPELVHLKFGTFPFMSFAVMYMAQKNGYFAAQGLDVELVQMKSSNEAVPLLLQGELDALAPTPNAALFNSIAAGANLKIVMGMTQLVPGGCAYSGIVARKADVEAGRFTNYAQWQGATLAMPAAGLLGAQGFTLSRALQLGGLTTEDVTVEPIDLAVQAEALQSGQVDMILATEPWVTRLLAGGQNSLLVSSTDLTPEMNYAVIVFGERLLQDPALGQRFALAYLQAVRDYQAGKTDEMVALVAEYSQLEPDLVKQVCWAQMPLDGAVTVQPLMDYQNWLLEQNLVDRLVQPAEMIDPSFAQAAYEQMQAEK